MLWLDGGERALDRLGEIGVKGVDDMLAFSFASGGACSTPSPLIGDFGDRGGVELTIDAVLRSMSSALWR